MAGRPSIYSIELAGAICERIATGEAVIDILRTEGMPSYTTVCKWRREIPEFAQMYAHARDDQADHEAEEIRLIADERPPMVGDTNHQAGDSKSEDGNTRMDSAFIAWQRNRIDVRKWRAAKMRPKVYADKVDHTMAGPDGGPVQAKVIVEFIGTAPGSVPLPVGNAG